MLGTVLLAEPAATRTALLSKSVIGATQPGTPLGDLVKAPSFLDQMQQQVAGQGESIPAGATQVKDGAGTTDSGVVKVSVPDIPQTNDGAQAEQPTLKVQSFTRASLAAAGGVPHGPATGSVSAKKNVQSHNQETDSGTAQQAVPATTQDVPDGAVQASVAVPVPGVAAPAVKVESTAAAVPAVAKSTDAFVPGAKQKISPGKLLAPVADTVAAPVAASSTAQGMAEASPAEAAKSSVLSGLDARVPVASVAHEVVSTAAVTVAPPQAVPTIPLVEKTTHTTSDAVASSQTASAQGQGTAEASVVQASPGVLELGLHSGTHGWVKVKAELDAQTGEVSAVVLADSAHAAATLHRELPAMEAYLAGEQVDLRSLTVTQVTGVEAFESGSATQGGGGGSEQQAGSGRELNANGLAELTIDSTDAQSSLGGYAGAYSGGWLNVLA